MAVDLSWVTQGACRSVDPDFLFVESSAQNEAKSICAGCKVRTECLAYALDNKMQHGVWGGMTDRERRTLLRRRPGVASWKTLFAESRTRPSAMSGHIS
ncbi:WhiB family transcriptional regulator [Streptomyces sp. NPDC048489]|uniref:WhiB family transcriptional regulator n=1 Tax=Streptomyces sp. NPDC048489 TaxID=3154504 RepID=UPI0034419124